MLLVTDVVSVSPQAWATRAPTSSCSVLGFPSSLLEGSAEDGSSLRGLCMAGFGVSRKSLGTVSVVCSVVLLLVPTRHYSVLGPGHAVGGP